MTKRWPQALGLLLCLLAGPARGNRYVSYITRSGDTPQTIAAEYYGNRARAQFITEFNGLPRNATLKPGQALRIPTAYRYRMPPGEMLTDLAGRLLGDPRRAPFLVQLSGLPPGTKVVTGTEIQVPFQFVHVVKPGETLSGLAQAYYGDPSLAKLLAQYNFAQGVLYPGERVVIPITHVRVRSVRLPAQQAPVVRRAPPLRPFPPARMQTPSVARPAPQQRVAAEVAAAEQQQQQREAELATQVRAKLQIAEQAYRDGNYAEVQLELFKLMAAEDPSEAQMAEIYRLLAFAHVAQGQNEVAVKEFREVLERQPDFKPDPALTSPKILAVLAQARAQQ